jgi:hypothetical protein
MRRWAMVMCVLVAMVMVTVAMVVAGFFMGMPVVACVIVRMRMHG